MKTRLIGDLTPEQAAALHEAFLGDLVERLRAASFRLELAWALEPGEGLPAGPIPGFAQQGGDLGERLWAGLDRVAVESRFVAAVGSDHPDLPTTIVEAAFRHLEEGADVVLGPAEDGGYYLVGVRRDSMDRRIFESIEWSTDRVLAETRERCAGLGLRVKLLASAADVDTPDDLRRLAGRLFSGEHAIEATHCPRTVDLLRSWGLYAEEGA